MPLSNSDVMFKRKFTHLVRCDLCSRVGHYAYSVNIGEHTYNLCSTQHAQRATENYEKNKNIPLIPEEREEVNYESEE